MDARTTTCPGCGLTMPAGELIYDGYFNCTPECWSAFCEVLEAEFQNAVLFGQVHQLSVDAYAVQHAGGEHPDKSVDVHLVGLHLVHERGVASPDVPARLQRMAARVDEWPHFEPPADTGPLTVFDVAAVAGTAQHAARAREWSAQVWRAWREHHAALAELAELCHAVRTYRAT